MWYEVNCQPVYGWTSDGQISNPNLTVKSHILCFQIPISMVQFPNPNPKSQPQNSTSQSNLKSQSLLKTIKQHDCVKYRTLLANVVALFSNESYCQAVPKFAFKCQIWESWQQKMPVGDPAGRASSTHEWNK